MTDFDATRKTTQKARDTMEQGTRAAEQSVRGAEQSYSATVNTMRDFNMKLIEITQANAEAACHLARDMTAATSPSDMFGVWLDHSRKHFETLTKHGSELATLGQKMAAESATPMTRGVEQMFAKAS